MKLLFYFKQTTGLRDNHSAVEPDENHRLALTFSCALFVTHTKAEMKDSEQSVATPVTTRPSG